MKKTTYKQSKSAKQFYNAIKMYAAKKFNVDANDVYVVGNSMNYPDSVSMPTDMFMAKIVGFVRYDKDGKTVGQYAMPAEVAAAILNDCVNQNKTVVTRGCSGIDQLIRIEWNYLENYSLKIY